MHFRVRPLRFSFVARDPIRFPSTAANILRGAFGSTLRSIACAPDCPGARQCPTSDSCPYARMFEPSGAAPSGLADWPRPFVFRASHLDNVTVPPGSRFYFDMNVFDMRTPSIAHIVDTFARIAEEGLSGSRAELTAAPQSSEPLVLSLAPSPNPIDRVRIRFLTPTELKPASRPDFGVLMARIRDRISTLRALYDTGPLEIDFPAFAARASTVRMTRCDLQQVESTRRSSRTKQTHSLGGFIGEAEYEGDLAEFVPFLQAAQWTGVGRQTVWGKGEIAVAVFADLEKK